MSRFNTATSVANKTVNLAGGEAYVQNPKLELLSLLLTSFVKDKFYESADETLTRLQKLIALNDKEFAAKALIYARTVFGMRSITHAGAGEIAKTVKGESWTKFFFDKIVYRPDDMTEIRAYYVATGGGKAWPHAMRKGFATALSRMNEYQLAKYRGEKQKVSLVDVVNAVHPQHTEALAKLIKGELVAQETWEYHITQAGQLAKNEQDKEERIAKAWFDLLSEKKLGYMALLKNVRNIIEKSPQSAAMLFEQLQNEEAIKKSLVLPFRFTTALEEIQKLNGSNVRDALVAVSNALDLSVSNVPKLEGSTLIALDTSGSMQGKPSQIGSLFAAVLYKSNNADLLVFDNDARYVSLNPTDSVATTASRIPFNGGGTNFNAIFETANRAYDRIIILSDMQAWIGRDVPTAAFHEYKNRTSANPKVYSFDLTGYGTMQFPEANVVTLAGFSEKIFDVMKFVETDKNALIHEVEKIQL